MSLNGSVSKDGGKRLKIWGICTVIFTILPFQLFTQTLCILGQTVVFTVAGMRTTCEIVENLPLSQFYHISIDNEEPYNIYGGLQDNGPWYGPSASPGGINARDWNSLVSVMALVFGKTTLKILFTQKWKR